MVINFLECGEQIPPILLEEPMLELCGLNGFYCGGILKAGLKFQSDLSTLIVRELSQFVCNLPSESCLIVEGYTGLNVDSGKYS